MSRSLFSKSPATKKTVEQKLTQIAVHMHSWVSNDKNAPKLAQAINTALDKYDQARRDRVDHFDLRPGSPQEEAKALRAETTWQKMSYHAAYYGKKAAEMLSRAVFDTAESFTTDSASELRKRFADVPEKSVSAVTQRRLASANDSDGEVPASTEFISVDSCLVPKEKALECFYDFLTGEEGWEIDSHSGGVGRASLKTLIMSEVFNRFKAEHLKIDSSCDQELRDFLGSPGQVNPLTIPQQAHHLFLQMEAAKAAETMFAPRQ